MEELLNDLGEEATKKLAGLALKAAKYLGIVFGVMLVIDIITFIIFMILR